MNVRTLLLCSCWLVAACIPLEEPVARELEEQSARDSATKSESSRREGGASRLDGGAPTRRDATPEEAEEGGDELPPLEDGMGRDDEPSDATLDAAVSSPSEAAPSGPTKKRLGDWCKSGSECELGHCVDGICCAKADCGTCSRCGSEGACVQITEVPDDDSCIAPRSCNSRGECLLESREPCREDSECVSDACLGGRCCQRRCPPCSTCGSADLPGFCDMVSGDEPSSCPLPSTCGGGKCATINVQQLTTSSLRPLAPDEWLYQSFTTTRAGELVEVRVDARCPAGARPFLDVHAIGPRDEWLGTGPDFGWSDRPVPVTVRGYSAPMLAFRLRTSATDGSMVQAGQRLIVRFRAPESVSCSVQVANADVYRDGHGLTPTGFNNEFTTDPPYEVVFQVLTAP